MSTGLECHFYERSPGRWYYVLQDWDCPRGAWDWREVATAYGPFPSYAVAREDLRACHANPGGHSRFGAGEFAEDETLARLFAEADRETGAILRDADEQGRM